MNSPEKIILIGYGGHGLVAADILLSSGKTIAGYCDVQEKTANPFNLAYKGSENSFFSSSENIQHYQAFVAVGDNDLRGKIVRFLFEKGVNIVNACHPNAIVSNTVKMGVGVFIAPGAVINACSEIGNGVICNTGSVIDHECFIDEYSHICPGTVLCGNVSVGKTSFIGANSTVIPGKKIANQVIVGAGCTVITDLLIPGIYVGTPAKLITKNP